MQNKTYGAGSGVGYAVPPDYMKNYERLERAAKTYVEENMKQANQKLQHELEVNAAQKMIPSISHGTNSIRKFINKQDNDGAYKELLKLKQSIGNIIKAYNVSDEFVPKVATFLDSDADVESQVKLIEDSIGKLEEFSKKALRDTDDVIRAKRNYEGLKQDAWRAGVPSMQIREIDSKVEEALKQSSPYDMVGTYDSEPIPNYRQAMPEASRACLNCRFFKVKAEGDSGYCEVYKRDVMPDHVCDAWQATNLTDTHTPVRQSLKNDNAEKYSAKTDDVSYYTAPMERISYVASERQGVVPSTWNDSTSGKQHEMVNYNTVQNRYREEYDIPEPLRNATRTILPNDIVYSKSLNTLARVISLSDVDGIRYFSLELLNAAGIPFGSAFSVEADLVPRSANAVKHIAAVLKGITTEGYSSYKGLEEDIDTMIEYTRGLYKALDSIVNAYKNAPLTNEEVLTPLHNEVLKLHEEPVFQNVKTGRKRKYLRAVEHAMYAIGAARGVLFEAQRTVDAMTDGAKANGMKQVVTNNAQKDAMNRVIAARNAVYDALTKPSATHGDAAPGIKYYNGVKTVSDQIWDVINTNGGTIKSEVNFNEIDTPNGVRYVVRQEQDVIDIDTMRNAMKSIGNIVESYRERINGVIYNTIVIE